MKKLALVVCMLATSVSAQELVHPPEGAFDPYSEWQSPVAGPCCARKDCGVAQRCTVRGAAGYLEKGTCWPLPPDRYVEPPVPLAGSGELHVCRSVQWINGQFMPYVRCWTDGLAM